MKLDIFFATLKLYFPPENEKRKKMENNTLMDAI